MSAAAGKADYAAKPSPFALKRLSKEKQKLEETRQEVAELGIFFHWGDELNKALALIVGPKETPYDGGFYLFDVAFPSNYPMSPPQVTFRTGDGRVRFNPNLYEAGKVCLSILGTWQGPSWTSSGTLRTVLVSIQSLLNAHPIQNEPGHEKERGRNDTLYSEIIRYENVAIAVAQTLRRIPPKFEAFQPQMRKLFLERFDEYLQTVASYEPKDGTSARSPIWGFQTKFRPKELSNELRELRDKLSAEGPEDGTADATASAVEEPPCKRQRDSS